VEEGKPEAGFHFAGRLAGLHGKVVGAIAHLQAVDQGSSAPQGAGDMDRFGHLGQVRALFQAGLGVGANGFIPTTKQLVERICTGD